VIKKGQVIIYPTDTVYGLGVNALDEKAVKKIFEIKGRDFNKPISIIVKSIEMAKEMANFGKDIEKILEKILPGPVTVILYKKKILPNILTGGSKKIGLRVPDYKFTQILMENLDFPITTTSANISGEPSSGNIKDILNQFKNQKSKPVLILDAGTLPEKQPSTVLDLTGPEPKILRTGPVTKNELKKLFKNL
jgi:L-threonylcarbamoyladenylate synthase